MAVQTRSGRRRTLLTRPVELLLALALATAAGLFIAATTQVGPVLLTLTPNHGVHLGDVLAFAVFYTAALVAAMLIRRPGMLIAYTLATLGGLFIAAATTAGPVLVRVSPGFRIQLGDVLGFLACYAAVALAGRVWPARALRSRRGRANRSGGVAQPRLPRR